jgi:beta-glucosidase
MHGSKALPGPYESRQAASFQDPARPVEDRVEALLELMTLPEKAGLMFHPITPLNMADAMGGRTGTAEMITAKGINHFNVMGSGTPAEIAELHNSLQRIAAEETRLGIPITLSSDPRHAFADNPATAMAADGFSQWPEPIGLAATGDPAIVREFGDIARQEYLAVGLRVALHPMADLATEPRWGRIVGTFGEDVELASHMVEAYISGFQGASLGPASVACMTKHFPGGGPEKDGEDSHFPYGREQVYPAHYFDYHLIPFEAAFTAGTAQIMPYYSMPVGTDLEEVGFAFNKEVITGMLREHYGFDGVVCADWGVLNDSVIFGRVLPARAWGVEQLSVPERAKKAIEAGIDQFGSEACPEVIVGLVESGEVAESRIDQSVRRLLRDKVRLGLFEHRYVDVKAAERIAGKPAFREAGERAQRASIVLLKNGQQDAEPLLPLRNRPRIFVENVDPAIAWEYGEVVSDLVEADLAVLRISAPYEPRDSYPLEDFFHAGDLTFPPDVQGRILSMLERVPTVVDIFLDRPAVIPEIAVRSAALLGSFGASDRALLEVIFGRYNPTGRLPFELPSSMDAVRAQHEDAPYDSAEPPLHFGHGLRY